MYNNSMMPTMLNPFVILRLWAATLRGHPTDHPHAGRIAGWGAAYALGLPALLVAVQAGPLGVVALLALIGLAGWRAPQGPTYAEAYSLGLWLATGVSVMVAWAAQADLFTPREDIPAVWGWALALVGLCGSWALAVSMQHHAGSAPAGLGFTLWGGGIAFWGASEAAAGLAIHTSPTLQILLPGLQGFLASGILLTIAYRLTEFWATRRPYAEAPPQDNPATIREITPQKEVSMSEDMPTLPDNPRWKDRAAYLAKRAWHATKPYRPAMVNVALALLIAGIYQAMQDAAEEDATASSEE